MLSAFNRLRIKQNQLALFAVIGLLALLVVFFGGGAYSTESIQNSGIAWDLASAFKNQAAGSFVDLIKQNISGLGFRNFVLLFPLAILYSLFGPSSLVTIAVPALAAFLTTFLVYKIGQLLRNSEFGLWAAFLFVLIPQNLVYSSVYSSSTFLLMFALLAFYFVIKADSTKTGRSRVAFLIACLIVVSACFFLAEWGLVVLAFVLVFLLRNQLRWLIAALFTLSILWIVLLIKYLSLSNLNVLIQHSPTTELFTLGAVALILLFSIAGSIRLHQEDKNVFLFIATWLTISLFWVMPYYYSSYENLFQLVLLPLAYFAAAFFVEARIWKSPFVLLAGLLALILAALVTLQMNPMTELVPGLLGLDMAASWQVQNSILTGSILVGGLIFYFLIIALLVSSLLRVRLKPPFFGFAALLLVIALIAPLNAEVIVPKASVLNADEVLNTISSRGLALPLFVDDPILAERLRYVQGYSDGVEVVTLENVADLPEDAYILFHTLEVFSSARPWWLMEQFSAGNQASFWLARKLSKPAATAEYEAATRMRENGSSDWPQRLVGALINLERYCEAYSTWADSVSNHAGVVAMLPVFHLECFDDQDEQDNLTQTLGHWRAWFSLPGRLILTNKEVSAEGGDYNFAINYHPFDSVFYDTSSLFAKRSVDANSFWLYTVRLSSEGSASPLYWRIGDQESAMLVNVPIPELTEFAFLLHVPKDALATEAYLSPALLVDKNTILHVYDVRFGQIELDALLPAE